MGAISWHPATPTAAATLADQIRRSCADRTSALGRHETVLAGLHEGFSAATMNMTTDAVVQQRVFSLILSCCRC